MTVTADRQQGASAALAQGQPMVTCGSAGTSLTYTASNHAFSCMTQIDITGHLTVTTRPDPPDPHPWIIGALVLVVIWMWLNGAVIIWVVKVTRWWHGEGDPPPSFFLRMWRWRFLTWPLFPFWGGE